ncbi:MAG: glycosyltransferase family 4 protein [Acidimicrobiia bacterium]|nr:glycosyltransferase family 4 protein [bacterium]MXZ30410.1 glycosyltransferase family 4 protein [Acidimicrobiia bacterium]
MAEPAPSGGDGCSPRRHLLVTNDYPPKLGGIQNYLWELWRRLPPDRFCVLTRPHPASAAFDAGEPYKIVRSKARFLLPTPSLLGEIRGLLERVGAELVVFDPAVPVGALGPRLDVPYGVVLHGAEVTVPARLPVAGPVLRRTLAGAEVVISASRYAAGEAKRLCPDMATDSYVPPGVDLDRFAPLSAQRRQAARRRLGLGEAETLILSVSRLVPRKGMDRLIEAVAQLAAHRSPIRLLIAGDGRDRDRLARLVRRTGAPARLLGRVAEAELAELYGAADLFAMLCRRRWFGLEQEGFGIVFLEAAAAGVAQVAGASGGAAEAVEHGVAGLVVSDPGDAAAVAAALASLIEDPDRRRRLGATARRRAEEQFGYDRLAGDLCRALS